MAVGTVQEVVICVPASSASPTQQEVCPKVGTTFYQPSTVQSYLLDPRQQNDIEAAVRPFDYAYAGSLWTLAFSTVVGLYFASHGIGLVLGMIRRR